MMRQMKIATALLSGLIKIGTFIVTSYQIEKHKKVKCISSQRVQKYLGPRYITKL